MVVVNKHCALVVTMMEEEEELPTLNVDHHPRSCPCFSPQPEACLHLPSSNHTTAPEHSHDDHYQIGKVWENTFMSTKKHPKCHTNSIPMRAFSCPHEHRCYSVVEHPFPRS